MPVAKLLLIVAIALVVAVMVVLRTQCVDPSCMRLANMLGLVLFPLFFLAIRNGEP